MAGTKELTVKTDSQLLANQVKGNQKVRNIRITKLIPIVHDLALHFEALNLDWIIRDQNKIADKLARMGAENTASVADERRKQPNGFKVEFNLNALMGRSRW